MIEETALKNDHPDTSSHPWVSRQTRHPRDLSVSHVFEGRQPSTIAARQARTC